MIMEIWILVITLCGGYGNTCNTIYSIDHTSEKRCIQAGNNYLKRHPNFLQRGNDLYCELK